MILSILSHAGEQHQNTVQSGFHYLLDTEYLLLAIAISWLIFYLIRAYLFKTVCSRAYFATGFAFLNILVGLIVDQQNLIGALILVNSGFVILIYNILKYELHLKIIFKNKE